MVLGGGGGGFETGIKVKPGIRVGEDGGGGGSENFYLRIKELFFFPCPCLTPIVSDIQYDLNEEQCKKWRKTCGESAFSRRASPAMPHHLAWVRYCVLINAILLR